MGSSRERVRGNLYHNKGKHTMKTRFILIVVSMLLALQRLTYAQETSTNIPPFAATEDGALVVADANGEPQEVYRAESFQDLDWNADGTILAFLQLDEEFTTSLGIYDTATGEVTLFDTPTLDTGFNLSWLSDGRILFAAESAENDPANNPDFYTDILAIEPAADAQPDLLGTFTFSVGCGGGSNIPADWLYGEETSSFMANHLTLAETPYGILASLNCGGTGVGLLDSTTGEFTIVSETLSRVVVSPDGTQAAGVELNYDDPTSSTLLVYQLDTLAVNQIDPAAAPDQIIWSADGSNLYYSTRTLTGNLIDDLSADEQAALNSAVGYELTEMPAYQSDLYVVPAAGRGLRRGRCNGFRVCTAVR